MKKRFFYHTQRADAQYIAAGGSSAFIRLDGSGPRQFLSPYRGGSMLCDTHVVQAFTVRGWVPSPSTERAGVGVQSGGTEITSLSPHPNLPPPGRRGKIPSWQTSTSQYGGEDIEGGNVGCAQGSGGGGITSCGGGRFTDREQQMLSSRATPQPAPHGSCH
jgi:hypothetical protein